MTTTKSKSAKVTPEDADKVGVELGPADHLADRVTAGVNTGEAKSFDEAAKDVVDHVELGGKLKSPPDLAKTKPAKAAKGDDTGGAE